jgi:hypothetical protein
MAVPKSVPLPSDFPSDPSKPITRNDRDLHAVKDEPEHGPEVAKQVAAAKERLPGPPLYLDFSELQQLIGDIFKDVPTGDSDLLYKLEDDLQRAGRLLRLRESVETYDPSTAEIEVLSNVEFHLGKAIEALRPTTAAAQAVAQCLFLMLLPMAHSPEAIEHAIREVQSLDGWMSDYRRSHPPIRKPGRPSKEAQTWLVENELPRIFRERFKFLEAHLTPQELAKRRNLFVVRAAKLLGVSTSRDAIKKRQQRAETS